jgi:hypothetical protein
LFINNLAKAKSQSTTGGDWFRGFVLICERVDQGGQVGHIGFEPEKQRFFLKVAKAAKMAKFCANVLSRPKRIGRWRKDPSPNLSP